MPWSQSPQVSGPGWRTLLVGVRQPLAGGSPYHLFDRCSPKGPGPGAVVTGAKCGFRHHSNGEENMLIITDPHSSPFQSIF